MSTIDDPEEGIFDANPPLPPPEENHLSVYILSQANVWPDDTLPDVPTWQDQDQDLEQTRMRPTPSSIPVRLLTHNIRYATTSPFPGEKPWSIRHPLLSSQLNFTTFNPISIICLQEVLHSQLLDIQSSLNSSTSSGNAWSYVGVGRDDGKEAGEYAPIFYRPAVWRLMEWKTVWLSESPDRPGKGWDASSVRIVTVAELEFKYGSNRRIKVLNTHFDDQGIVARRESAKLLLSLISNSGLGSPQSQPASETSVEHVFVTGDFNSPPTDEAYKIITASDSPMEDVRGMIEKEKRYGNENTFTSFGHVDNRPERIDFIFTRKGDKLEVKSYGVLGNRFDDEVYLSDHRAVVADFLLLPSA